MAKAKEPVITVSTIFAGGQTDRQAFLDLIAQKRIVDKSQFNIDFMQQTCYNEDTPKRGIHSGTESKNEP